MKILASAVITILIIVFGWIVVPFAYSILGLSFLLTGKLQID